MKSKKQKGDLKGSITIGTIPVVEETIRIDKEVIDTGVIRIIKKVDEETVLVPVSYKADHYTVERVPINQYVERAPLAIRQEGNITIISVVAEEVIIQKRLKVVEELRITHATKEMIREEEITLKKERVIVKRSEES